MPVTGRWPANVILSPGSAQVLDEQSGHLSGGCFPGSRKSDKFGHAYGEFKGDSGLQERKMDSGGASKFFLEASYEPWEVEWIYSVGLRPHGMEEA